MPDGFPYKRVVAEIVPLALLELTAELEQGSGADLTEADAVKAFGVSIMSGYRSAAIPALDETSLPVFQAVARRARRHLGRSIIAGVYDRDETTLAARLIQEIAGLEAHLNEFERSLR